jgi:hypothetical protein
LKTVETTGDRGYFMADTGVGSFARRVCGNQPCRYTGVFGSGSGVNAGEGPWYPSSSMVSNPSLSQTSIANVAGQILASEGSMWDLWMGRPGLGGNPCTYGIYWIPADYDVIGASTYHMACSHARKRAKTQSPDGACTPALCDGMNYGIQNGFTTFVAADGHAIATDYRGGLFARATLPDGSIVVKSMWPDGGF